jgi:serine/threonine protein kinase
MKSAEIVKDSRTTTVSELQIAGKKIYLKRYNYQGWPYALKDLFRRSRARRVWIAANSCALRDVAVARPLAYLERRQFGFLLESYIVTEADNGGKLRAELEQCAADFRRKRALIRELAFYLRRMHDRHVQNRDLKADNMIVSQKQPSSYAFFVVDFDGIEIGPVSWRTRVKNLTRLEREFRGSAVVTRTDRLRFLSTYLGPRFADSWKRCWRGIARQADVD